MAAEETLQVSTNEILIVNTKQAMTIYAQKEKIAGLERDNARLSELVEQLAAREKDLTGKVNAQYEELVKLWTTAVPTSAARMTAA